MSLSLTDEPLVTYQLVTLGFLYADFMNTN